ncbi:putative reverse transcriptase zinc-binding domain-containing protein [Arabidopsis thaliana]
MNEVSCLKLIWRIVSHANSLWVRWVEKYLLKQATFWSVRTTTNLGSWMWRKLLKYRDTAKHFCRAEVQNGERVSFWYENWSNLGILHDILGDRGRTDLGITSRMTVSDAWAGRQQRRHRTVTLNQIEEALRSQYQNRVAADDRILWRGRNDEFRPKFSTRDTWNQLRTTSATVTWHTGIWFAHATPKYSFCTWLAVQNKLTTGDRMLKWNRGLSSTCVLCNNTMETRNHLFFSCCYSAEIWSNLANNIYQAKFSTNWSSLVTSLSTSWRDSTKSFLARYIFQAAIHTIWHERNGRRHGERPNTAAQLIRWLDKQIRNQISTITASGDYRYEKALQLWFQSRS